MQSMYGDTVIYEDITQKYFIEREFLTRKNRLNELETEHMFKIREMEIDNKNVKIHYEREIVFTLEDIISIKVELKLHQIKSIIWQITKTMLAGQKRKINHLKLCPKSIVFNQEYDLKKRENFFIYVKDYSMGKQFNSIMQGKQKYYFEYLHPNLSVENQFFQFQKYTPKYDIWSLGIIIYQLLYFHSPFIKKDTQLFSKTVMRQFRKGEYLIHYENNCDQNLKQFINFCVTERDSTGFLKWQEVKDYLCSEREIYNSIDFQSWTVKTIAIQHVKIMYLFSAILTMMIQQYDNSPFSLWKARAEDYRTLLIFKLGEVIIFLMKQMHTHYLREYSAQLFLLQLNRKYELQKITDSIRQEISFIGKQWSQPLLAQQYDQKSIERAKQIMMKYITVIYQSSYTVHHKHFLWKKVKIVYLFFGELVGIMDKCQVNTKFLYEMLYASKILHQLAVEQFDYPYQSQYEIHNQKNIQNQINQQIKEIKN